MMNNIQMTRSVPKWITILKLKQYTYKRSLKLHLETSRKNVKFESESNKDLVGHLKEVFKRNPIPPPLKCSYFWGLGDRDKFQEFLSQFDNVIGCKKDLSNLKKLAYLKSYLRDYAYSVVKHF